MRRSCIVLRRLPDGRVAAFVHRRHGRWRRLVLRGVLADWLAALGSATTVPPAVLAEAAQAVPLTEVGTPLLPRPGPLRT